MAQEKGYTVEGQANLRGTLVTVAELSMRKACRYVYENQEDESGTL
jgi:hypothetical protein